MKKALFIGGAVVLVVVIAFGVCLSASSTVDFRGEITAKEKLDGTYVFTLDGIDATRYTVIADEHTNIRYCHSEDGDISVVEIEVGDTVQGNYSKWFAKDDEAREIVVQCE